MSTPTPPQAIIQAISTKPSPTWCGSSPDTHTQLSQLPDVGALQTLDLAISSGAGALDKLDWLTDAGNLEISIPETAKISIPQNSATPRFYQRLKINWSWEEALRKTETETFDMNILSTLKINVKSKQMIGKVNFTILTCMIAALTSLNRDSRFRRCSNHQICLSCGGAS